MSLWQSAVTPGILQLPLFCILQLLLNGPIISLWQSAVAFCSWSLSTTVTPSQPHYKSMAICSYPWYSAVAPFCILQLLLNGPIISLWQSAVTFCSWSLFTTVTPPQPHCESMAICSYPWYFTVTLFCILQLLLNGPIITLWQSAVTYPWYSTLALHQVINYTINKHIEISF